MIKTFVLEFWNHIYIYIYIESRLILRKTKNLDKKLDYFITQLNKHIFELTSESKMKD